MANKKNKYLVKIYENAILMHEIEVKGTDKLKAYKSAIDQFSSGNVNYDLAEIMSSDIDFIECEDKP